MDKNEGTQPKSTTDTATPVKEIVMCGYCSGTGEIEMDNNGPIVPCPMCFPCDKRPQKGWWAPGNYTRKCYKCDKEFIGDKRAGHCAPCAYGDT